jgi:hypothetical protein
MATPSLLMIPSAFKSGVLASVLPSDGTGDFTVSRPSIATRINKEGVRETVAANIARIDYSDVGCPVLLTEPQSTNDYLNMQSMVTQTTTTVADTYTVSFEGTGTIALSGTFTGSLVGTGVNNLVQLTFTATSGALLSTVSGTVNEAQLEKLTYATSRIRTLGTTVTRLADVVTGAGDVNTFNSEEGVLYLEIAALNQIQTVDSTLSITDEINNHIIFRYRGTNQVNLKYFVNGFTQGETTYTLSDSTLFNKIAIKWKLNDWQLYVNGVAEFTDNTALVPAINSFNTINLADNIGNSHLLAKTKDIRVYKSISEAQADLPYIT